MRFFCCFSFWECHVWRFLFINSLPLWPHLTLREYDLNKLNLHYLRMLPRKFQLSDRLFVRNIFKDFLLIFLSEHFTPLVVLLYPWAWWFEQSWIYIAWGCFKQCYSYSGEIPFEKIFLNFFFLNITNM